MKEQPGSSGTAGEPQHHALSPSLAGSAGIATVGGALIALQILFNGALGAAGSGPLLASFVSYLGTLVSAILVIAVIGQAAEVFLTIRKKGRPWWFMVGVSGVPIVITTAWGAPILGVAVSAVCSIGGQTVAGLLLDSRGIGVKQRIPLTPNRILAAVIAVVGLALAIGPGISELREPAVAAVAGVAIFISGMLLAVLNAGNGAVAGISGNSFVPVVTSVIGGTITVSIIAAVMWALDLLPASMFPAGSQWWMYLGGPAGMGIVLASTIAVRTLGTFGLTLIVVVGQMVTALLIDLFIDGAMDWGALISSAVMVLAIFIAVQPRKENKQEV